MASTKKKQFRKRRQESSSSEDEEEMGDRPIPKDSITNDIKALQKLRKRPNGVNVIGLALGKKLPDNEPRLVNDPFKMDTGGIVDMKALKEQGKLADPESIGTSFAAETNRRDEDADMLKYVEKELAKKKGLVSKDESPEKKSVKTVNDVLFDVPEHLRATTMKRTEDMLSNQMLSGIPEVDLGIDAKIRNIEQTEDAKQKLIELKMKRNNEKVSAFVPTNMAVNFVQHNRFNIDDNNPILKKEEPPKPKMPRVGDAESIFDQEGSKKKDGEKATDDYHYERFKKQMRRY
ncbi:splicing factor C9orf78-like [Tubulanus polymorphus]|uniref:splicing factor C9orf78-like n=1 Tax=Tubulanus polymorphus TaxID=672921 RepID=UPI003DA1FB5D